MPIMNPTCNHHSLTAPFNQIGRSLLVPRPPWHYAGGQWHAGTASLRLPAHPHEDFGLLAGLAATVSGLARCCEVSRERVHRVVTKRLGIAPRDYLRAVRLHRAKTLLLEGEPITSVAADCGFADQAHFTRWFRRTFGYTPGDLVDAALPPPLVP